ncbi:hypothetical protein CCR85_07215 [Rhodothalassium salexigens]|uniref:YCII-related domain-containing protein n=1 Tax=Rhodothalassium salexigens DSM 2132 TaxID=1188247 RepID=A0A4R2PMB3_RHOSA|nr:YciI family protein [Rhodothalassium salexigens]MBB4211263.1 hypothetical protein [Rhodothalassium salexigens DSM 2132]MBK1639357.1 hypothetical protein [Rhodothalassium salexigens DSM 2132]MBK5911281.1 hypothetical protein [Rhodothalassium salexigens]TCP35185.1 hypothetical protein EV659_10435 [Rhodothalassium salexigens DSM 2132]
MLYIIIAKDKPDAVGLRTETRHAHLQHLKGMGDRLKVAGPLRLHDGADHPAGSVIVVEAASLSAARLAAEADPYFQAGLFESVEVRPFNPLFGPWAETAKA